MLAGIGHTHYWAGAPAGPAATTREGNMHGFDSAGLKTQTTRGAVHAAALAVAVLEWLRRLA